MAFELRRATRQAWRKFLHSEPGVGGLLFLREQAPSVGGGGESHSIIFQAGKVEGYREAINKIYEISADEQESVTSIDNP